VVVPAAGALGLHRPVALHPAALVDVVDEEVAVAAAAGPQEAVELADLVLQLAHLLRPRPDLGAGLGPLLPVGLQQHDVADGAPLELLQQLGAGDAVAAHQANADLQPRLDRLLAELEHAAAARAVHRDRLLHEDVDALLNGVGEVDPAKGRRRGQDDHVPLAQAVDGGLVGVEAEELARLGYVHQRVELVAEEVLEVPVGAGEAVLEDVGHGDELDRAALGVDGVDGGAGAAAAAADEGDTDGVVLRGVDVRDGHAGEGRDGRDAAGGVQEFAARNSRGLRVGHE